MHVHVRDPNVFLSPLYEGFLYDAVCVEAAIPGGSHKMLMSASAWGGWEMV